MKFIKLKVFSLLLLSCLAPVSKTQAFPIDKIKLVKPYIIGAVAGATGVAAIWSYLSYFKQKNPAELLESTEKLIKNFMYNYNDQILLVQNKENLSEEQFNYKLTQIMLNKIVSSSSDIISFGGNIKADLNKFLSYKIDLDLKVEKLTDQEKEDSKLIEKISGVKNKLENIIKFLETYYNVFLAQKSFLDLALILDQNLSNKYEKEVKYYSSSDINFEILDVHIRSVYSSSDVFFPYLSYADQLKHDKDKLQNILVKVVDNRFEFQNSLLAKGNFLLEVLNSVLEFVISTKTYKNEKARKPEFDREQARLRMVLQERQALIDQKNAIAKSKLIKKQNKNQKLLNENLKKENDKKALIVKEQNIKLEAARIADGITVQTEIAENDRKWSTRVNVLTNKINQAKSNLSDLTGQFSRPPFNPQIVDGLSEFLNNLKYRIQAIKNNL